jgi:hypothetical protein
LRETIHRQRRNTGVLRFAQNDKRLKGYWIGAMTSV